METYIPKSIDEFAELFFRHQKFFWVPFFLVILITGAVFFLIPKTYEAEAILISDLSKIANPLERDRESQGTQGLRLNQLKLLILGASDLTALLTKLGYIDPNADPLSIEKQILAIKKKGIIETKKNGFISVKYSDRDPKRAYGITNALADSLVEKNIHLYEIEAKSRVDFVYDQLRIYKEKLETSEVSSLALQLTAELGEALRRREVLVGQNVLGPTRIQSELAQTEADLKKLLIDATPEHPMVAELNEKINRLRRALVSNVSVDSPSDNPSLQQALLRRSESIKEVDLEIAAIRRNLQSIQAGQSSEITKQDMAVGARDKKVNEDIYQSLLLSLANANISQKLGYRGKREVYEIIEYGVMPIRFSKPNPINFSGAGFVFALLLGIGILFLREYSDSSFRSVKDAREYLNIPLLGHISLIESQKNKINSVSALSNQNGKGPKQSKEPFFSPNMITYHQPNSKITEQFRMLRTHLIECQSEKSFHSLLVTSTLEGEGKSTTAANLGMSFALETDRRVVVVDADLRRGTISDKFGFSKKDGLMEFLNGQATFDQVVQSTAIKNLSLVSSGSLTPSPAKVLSGDRLQKFISELRSHFDLILVDSPPVLDMADVPILSTAMDAVMFVVRAGKTRREQVQSMNLVMNQFHHAKVLGYVLTHVDSKLPSYLSPYMPTGY